MSKHLFEMVCGTLYMLNTSVASIASIFTHASHTLCSLCVCEKKCFVFSLITCMPVLHWVIIIIRLAGSVVVKLSAAVADQSCIT